MQPVCQLLHCLRKLTLIGLCLAGTIHRKVIITAVQCVSLLGFQICIDELQCYGQFTLPELVVLPYN